MTEKFNLIMHDIHLCLMKKKYARKTRQASVDAYAPTEVAVISWKVSVFLLFI